MHDEHDHSHGHSHEHDRQHAHPHEHVQAGDAAKTLALLRYMLEHNRQHASELGAAGEKLRGDGRVRAAEMIADAVHYFDHGNEKLGEALELLGGEG